MSDNILRSEMCKSCAHTKVCMKDKNLCGDVFVMGHPCFFDNDELYRRYKEWEAAGFPCEDYLQEQKHGKWIEDGYYDEPYVCSICGEPAPVKEEGSHDHVCTKYCYNCGARMDGEA